MYVGQISGELKGAEIHVFLASVAARIVSWRIVSWRSADGSEPEVW